MTLNFKSTTVLQAVNEVAFCFNTTDKKVKIPPLWQKERGSDRAGVQIPPNSTSSCVSMIVLSTVDFRRTNVAYNNLKCFLIIEVHKYTN